MCGVVHGAPTVPVVTDGDPLAHRGVAQVEEVGLHELGEQILQVVRVWEGDRKQEVSSGSQAGGRPETWMHQCFPQVLVKVVAAQSEEAWHIAPWREFGGYFAQRCQSALMK